MSDSGGITLPAEDPRPPASRQLRCRPGWRVRVGDFRIISTIDDARLVVAVIMIRHRREVYDEVSPPVKMGRRFSPPFSRRRQRTASGDGIRSPAPALYTNRRDSEVPRVALLFGTINGTT